MSWLTRDLRPSWAEGRDIKEWIPMQRYLNRLFDLSYLRTIKNSGLFFAFHIHRGGPVHEL
jgi:hypothetical protein